MELWAPTYNWFSGPLCRRFPHISSCRSSGILFGPDGGGTSAWVEQRFPVGVNEDPWNSYVYGVALDHFRIGSFFGLHVGTMKLTRMGFLSE